MPRRVVQIAALGVEDFAEQSLAHEVQAEKLGAAVVDVLHHRAVAVRAFGGFDQLPAAFKGVGGGDLGDRMLAVLHGGDADGDVPAPGGRRVDQVEVLFGAEALEVGLSVGVERGSGVSRLFDDGGRAFGVLCADIADGGDHAAVDANQVVHMSGAHPADAHVANSHLLDGRGGEGLRRSRTQTAGDGRGIRHRLAGG